MSSKSFEVDDRNPLKVMGSPRSLFTLSHLLAPANSPNDSAQFHHQFIKHHNQSTRSHTTRSHSSSSNITEKMSNSTSSKLLNPFNDTNSSQSKNVNAQPTIEEHPTKFQLSEFIRNNSSLSNSQSSVTPVSLYNHNIENVSKSSKILTKISNIQQGLSSSPSVFNNPNLNGLLKTKLDSSFVKNFSAVSNESVLFNNISSPNKFERPKTNPGTTVLASMYSSPILPKSQSIEIEIDKAFLTSDNDFGNESNLYPNIFGPVPPPIISNIRSGNEAMESNINSSWLNNIRTKSQLQTNQSYKMFNNISQHNPNSTADISWIHDDTNEPLKEFAKDSDETISMKVEDTNSNLLSLLEESEVANNTNILSKNNKRGRKRKRQSQKVKSNSKSQILKQTSTKKARRLRLSKSFLVTLAVPSISKVSEIINPIAESTSQHSCPSSASEAANSILSTEEVQVNKDSDDEYIPGKYRQTRSRRRLTKTNPVDLEIEKKRRLGPRSKSGCWTCRVRHKACPEDRPVCSQCERLNLKCDYSEERPAYMTDPVLQAAKLKEIRSITSQQKKINFAKRRAKM